ncbi:MAG: hypothetical protein NTX75_06340 [Proteobacteria bacterium]|nr:hypothetical protein [Pseudomonadota bacterium]
MKTLFKKMIPESKHDLIRHIINETKQIHIDEQTKKFIRHNQEIWKDFSVSKPEAEVLFELTAMQPNIISYGYLANILAKKHNAEIMAYSFGENIRISRLHGKIYKSFNAKTFSYFLTQNQLLELEKLFNEVYSSLKTKKDVFNLSVSGVWFGDLLYDSHLRTHNVPTVVINDYRFKESLKKALYQYIFWRDYFDKHNVKAINVTHCAYLIAIPMRIAIQRSIPAYQCNFHGCYYMTKERLWAYNDYCYYPRQFRKLPEDKQKNGLKTARKQIGYRFAGKVGVDMAYSAKSAYTNIRRGKVLSENNKIKVLIAAHCFFDSPNGLGVNLFTDFYEWLTFLGYISEKTDYDWYIKTHPDYLPGNNAIINEFINKYPKFALIHAETSHHQIIDEGIDFALTVYGTIGFEYAALGVPVINASLRNPHVAYNFNIHPKTIDEYENILMNLADQKLDINMDEVYEYYYMHNIEKNTGNWLCGDYMRLLEEIGGYKAHFTSLAYEKFLAEFSQERHNRNLELLKNFIDSKDYCMQSEHYKDH